MLRIIEKVTAFVTRKAATGDELALFRHPYAGIQIPAGTVEAQEAPEAAALREAFEETGLSPLLIRQYLGTSTETLPEGEWVMLKTAEVYVRPDPDSSHCACSSQWNYGCSAKKGKGLYPGLL
jgi:8-oxo-dGTP pyrophosphatase MutT (NUDIX family)